MTLGPVWLVLTPPRERLPYCREERGRRSRARGTRWSLSPHHTALAARESPATSPAGQAPPRTLRLRAGGAPRVRAHFLRVRRGGRARREPRPRAPLPPSGSPSPTRCRGRRRSPELKPPGDSPSPLPSPAPPGAGAPESEPSLRLGVSTRTPPQHPLLGAQDPTTTPRKEKTKSKKKKHPDSAARPLLSTSCGTQRCPGPAGPKGGTLCPQTRTVPGQMGVLPSLSGLQMCAALCPRPAGISQGVGPPLSRPLSATLVPPAPSRCAAPARPSSGPSCSPAAGAAEGNHPPPPPSFAFWGRQVQCPRSLFILSLVAGDEAGLEQGGPGLGKGEGSRVLAPDGWLSLALVGTGLPAGRGRLAPGACPLLRPTQSSSFMSRPGLRWRVRWGEESDANPE